MSLTPLLQISALSKTFAGQRVLDEVDLDVGSTEVVAVVGQNGSGKSTLVKCLAGVYQPDPGGEIRVLGAGGGSLTGSEAQAELHFIHQDLGLVGALSTVENLSLGTTAGRRSFLPAKRREERARARARISEFGGTFDIDAPIASLSPAERTLVAISRALDGWTRPEHVLVLDEPTAALHGTEVHRLFDAVRMVASRGAGVIFISHRLDEVLSMADRVIAMRDGRIVADAQRGAFDHDELVRMIAGRDVAAHSGGTGAQRDEVVFRARGLAGSGIRNLDVEIRSGEVLGVAGILGSGRDEVAAMLFGARPRERGDVRVGGVPVPSSSPRKAIAQGLAYVPADRRGEGAVMSMSGRENLTLPNLRDLRTRVGSLNIRAERAEATRWAQKVALNPPLPDRLLENFSGGNQQKVVLAKWLRTKPRVLLLDDPTQGVDVGAKAAIYELIGEAARAGAAVLLSSTDTKELVAVSDRVIVMRDGESAAELERDSITEARITRESLGLSGAEASDLFDSKIEVTDR